MTRPRRSGSTPDKVSTWLALVGVLLGALIGAVPTYIAIGAQDDREAQAFLRDKRQAAYGQFILDEELLQRAEAEFVALERWEDRDGDGVPPRPTPQQIDQAKQQVEDGYRRLVESATAVQLVGSDGAQAGADEIRHVHGQINVMINPASEARVDLGMIESYMESVADNDVHDFIQGARQDLQVD